MRRPWKRCLLSGEPVRWPDLTLHVSRLTPHALAATLAALEMKGLPVPAPNSGGVVAERLVTRVPETVRARHFLNRITRVRLS